MPCNFDGPSFSCPSFSASPLETVIIYCVYTPIEHSAGLTNVGTVRNKLWGFSRDKNERPNDCGARDFWLGSALNKYVIGY